MNLDIIEFLGKASDSLEKFINELVATWRKGDRRRVFLVGFIFLFIFCASQQSELKSLNIPGVKDIPQFLPQIWVNILWILVALLFIGVIYESVKPPLPSVPEPTEFKKSAAIKGLRSFTEQDREIFQQLQRGCILQECLAEINRDRFRFGILFGESGCGKTSFIQARLIPQLAETDSKVQGIYVHFSERDPLVTIRQAFVEKLPLFPEDINQLDFLSLLSQGVEAASKPLVLIFDQFEQFFVHFKRKEDRKFFIQALANWYQHPQAPQVKILVSIRQDFYAYLVEIQKAFGDSYSLSPQEVIELEKFSVEEATNVIEVIARTTEGLEIDRAFTQRVAEQELASGEDGLISPVDLQLLAWIINGQKAAELRAFNEQAFQKLGGIEGLLTKFLERALQTRIEKNQREATIKVLRSLTDAERRVRAGILTFEEIQHKLPDLATDLLQETINWLKADGVRLITPIEREGIIGYELAHEKMIPALLKLADRELTAADKANQLLERRVNEWLSNNCDYYYLLRWRELRSIQKQQPYLKWGRNRQHKQKLINQSNHHFQLRFSIAIGLFVVIGLSWLGTNYYLSTPTGQIQQTRWELNRISKLVDSDEAAAKVAIAVAKDDDLKRARTIVKNQIENPKYKAEALKAIGKLKQSPEVIPLLKDALTSAKQIENPEDKAEALRAITAAIGQLDQLPKGMTLLKETLTSVKLIDNPQYKSWALRAIAEAYGELNQPQEGIKLLQAALITAQRIDDSPFSPSSKAEALRAIALSIGKLNQPEEGIKLLQAALITAQGIDDSRYKVEVLMAIAQAYGELNQPEEEIELLKDAFTTAQGIDNSSDKAEALREIAEAYGELNQPQKGITLLQEALTTAQRIDDSPFSPFLPSPKAQALRAIAQVYGKLNQPEEGIKLLTDALTTARGIDDSHDKAQALSAIARGIGELNQPQEGIKLLRDALTTAQGIDSSRYKAQALIAIAETQAEFANWGDARRVSNKITIQDEKAMSLAQVLTIWAEKQHPELAPLIND